MPRILQVMVRYTSNEENETNQAKELTSRYVEDEVFVIRYNATFHQNLMCLIVEQPIICVLTNHGFVHISSEKVVWF